MSAVSEDVTLFPSRKKSKSKVQVIREFASVLSEAEATRAKCLLGDHFTPEGLFHENPDAPEEFPGTLQALRDLSDELVCEGSEMLLLQKAWEGAKGDPLYGELCAEVPKEKRYISWVSGLAPEDIELPEGWPGWEPCVPMGDQPAMAIKSVRAKKIPDDPDAVKALSERKPRTSKSTTPESIRAAYDQKMAALDPATLYKPWMATKSIRLVDTMEEFQAWADKVFADKSLWRPCPVTGELMPVVAVDTENFGLEEGHSGLDTRLVNGKPQIDIAGACLCADGFEAIYVPINALEGRVVDRKAATALLQEISDRCLLVFFNAKYDREVLRITLGIKFRRYPYFEDVQVLHFLKDPKSDVDEEVSNMRSEGLKALSIRYLGIEQIELDELAKIKVRVTKADGSKGVRTLFAPFHWIPTSISYLYAAPDALTTWLLWDQMHEECRKMPYVHKIDHHLVDALAWIERQRPKIDIQALRKTCGWQQEKLNSLSQKLSEIAGETFNPKSADQLSRILFSRLNFQVVKRSAKTGKPSTDEEVLETLKKAHPHHLFLETLERFKGYASLHPGHLHYDPRDLTARLHFKQCTVAGGRLAAMGGEFDQDGGFGMNPQAIKAVGDNKWIPVRRLRLEDTEDLGEHFDPTTVPPLELDQVHDICRERDKKTSVLGGLSVEGVHGNHVARYCGEWWSIAKEETSITLTNGQTVQLDPPSQVDAEEVVNLRKLFVTDPGYTYFVIDYSNVEMRVAANCLAGDTPVLIKDKGFVPIKDNIGPAWLLDGNGQWVLSEIKSYGTQLLTKVRIGHNKVSYEFRATPNHRWVLGNGETSTTTQLKHQDQIPFVTYKRKADYTSEDYLRGVRHGLIYGDGDAQYKGEVLSCKRDAGYRIRLCGGSRPLVSYFEGYHTAYPEAYGGDAMVFLNDDFAGTHLLKELPDPSQEPEDYMVGFFRGWFAADGQCGKTSAASICCGPEEEEWLRRYMPTYGYYFLASSECPVERFCSNCQKYVRTKKRRLRKGLECSVCSSFVSIDAPLRFLEMEIKGRKFIRNKHSRSVNIFRPSLTPEDFLLDYKRDNFIASTFDPIERVRTVEPTSDSEEVFCAEVPTTHSFVIEGGILTGNCSLEPKFIEEFLHGSGDFHTLTAKSVFPEFNELQAEVKALQESDPLKNDPSVQSRIQAAKAKMKKIRSLAKIINFALLYGGTEYSIFQNMRLEDPTITKEKAKAMVDAYWESVPKFKEWAEAQQIRAKTTMICVTRSGRRINFKSAMEALGIYVPTHEHYVNNRIYWGLMRKADDLKAAKKDDEAQLVLAKAQEMKLDRNTGVMNVGDYNKFVGKTLRVSVNAPLQGLAGDFMRAALVAIYLWAQDAGLGEVFQLHATVHDEIDFSVKDEYVPYILPRIDRLMRHRKMHKHMGWPVPLETDCEYGVTWDVKEHLTGDDTHTPAGYTKVPGLEHYIPQMFDEETVKGLFDALKDGDRQSVADYLKTATHPRCHGNIPRVADMTTSLQDAERTLTAILQLHEYWTIDEEDPEDPEDETLREYQERMGLGPLAVCPPVEAMPINVTVAVETPEDPASEEEAIPEASTSDEPAAPVEPPPPLKMVPHLVNGYPQLRDLTEDGWAQLQERLGLGHATAFAAAPDGESLMRFSRVSTEQIPEDFLVLEVEGSVCG